MVLASEVALKSAMRTIALHMYSEDVELIAQDMEIDGREKTLVNILIDTSLVPSLLALVNPAGVTHGLSGVNTPPGPSSDPSLTNGLESWGITARPGKA